jgi:hypothetical protein
MTQNDEAWGKIFDSLPLLPEIERQGFVYVTADAIKAAGSRASPSPSSMPRYHRALTRPSTKTPNRKAAPDNFVRG